MEITVYTKRNCQACEATKKAMDRLGIDYELVDISNNQRIATFLRDEGHKSLPVVFVDYEETTEAWCGFRPDLIKQL